MSTKSQQKKGLIALSQAMYEDAQLNHCGPFWLEIYNHLKATRDGFVKDKADDSGKHIAEKLIFKVLCDVLGISSITQGYKTYRVFNIDEEFGLVPEGCKPCGEWFAYGFALNTKRTDLKFTLSMTAFANYKVSHVAALPSLVAGIVCNTIGKAVSST